MSMIKSLSLLTFLAAFLQISVATFHWDKDTAEDCEERATAGRCFKDSTTFYQCPVTCSKDLRIPDEAYMKQGETDDGEAFWELEVTMTNGKKMSFERYEGYVVLIVVMPLMPGMSQYYYDMLEHIHKVYPFTIEILVFPVRREDHPDVHLHLPETSKITVLPELIREGDKIEANPVLEYVEGVMPTREKFIFTVRTVAILFRQQFCPVGYLLFS
jgi:Glutathione peroxidase